MRRVMLYLTICSLVATARPSLMAGATDAARSVVVSVVNRKGSPVPGLIAEDFAVTVDGKAAVVDRADPAAGPLAVVVIADGLWADETLKARAAMANVAEALARHDAASTIGVMAAESAAAPQMAAVSTNAWRAIVDGFVESGKSAPTLESIVAAAHALESQPGRRLVFMISHRRIGSALAPTAVLDALEQADAELWVVDYARQQAGPELAEETVLRNVVPMTGGRRASILNDRLDTAARTLINQALSAYRVTYSSEASTGALRVGVRRLDLTVSARTWISK